MTMDAQTLTAPDAPFRLSAPIEHITKLDDGTVLAHVTVTSEAPDSQGEIVDYDAFKAAAADLMKWATLGEMHDPSRDDAGTILQLYFDDAARRVEADIHVVDPVAVKKVVNHVYKMVSIGGIKLATRLEQRGGQTLRRITKLIAEHLALVPRGANPDAMIVKQFVLAKRDTTEERMDAPLDAAQSSGIMTDTRTAEQVAIDETREALEKRDMDPNVGGGVDRDKIPAEDFAGPDRSFPIVTAGDVSDAASSLGRAKGDRDAIKAKIIAIARRKGFEAALPDTWKDGDMAKEDEAPEGEDKKPAFEGAAAPFKAKKAKKIKKAAPTPQELEERRVLKEATRLRKLRKARAELAKADVKLSKNDGLKAGQKAQQAVAEAMAEEQKEQAEGSDESDDLDNLKDADEALHAFTDAESKEDESVMKRYRQMRKQARGLRRFRKAAREVDREQKRIAKIGARNSGKDAEQHEAIHGALLKLGYSKCMTKSDETPADTAATETEQIAKAAAPDQVSIMRDALAGILPTEKIEAMTARLAALDEKASAQGEQLAKIAKMPTGGGPATAYSPVFRAAEPEVTDKASALAKAASVMTDRDDPRLRESIATAASLEAIRSARGG